MKRKIIAFPAAPTKNGASNTCTSGSCAAASTGTKAVTCANPTTDRASARAADLTTLLTFLPERHTYSLTLAEQLRSFECNGTSSFASGITLESYAVLSPGLLEIEVSIQPSFSPDGEYSNYGFTSWTIRIGGQGPGAENVVGMDNSHSLLTEGSAAPVAVRFTTPMAHMLVDDMGFVDNAVWSMLPDKQPSLVQVVTLIGTLLLAPQPLQPSDSALTTTYTERWHAAQRHAYNKHLLAQNFKLISKHPEFLCPRESYRSIQAAGWLSPDFVAMVTHLKQALAEAAGFSNTSSCKDHSISALMSYNSAQTAAVIDTWSTHVTQQHPGIFTFDMFTKQFCLSFVEELALFEASDLPRRRPNTMNNYGLILNDIGMYGLMSALMEEFLVPLVQVLFWQQPVAYGLDHHHSFIVQYQRSALVGAQAVPVEVGASSGAGKAILPAGDKGLDMHSDSSEVTVNVCLGKEGFQGGGLRFCGMAGSGDYRKLQYTLQHVIGRAVVHLGRHRHGADDLAVPTAVEAAVVPPSPPVAPVPAPIPAPDTPAAATVVTNERLNLIMWLRSSQFRAAAAYGHIAPDGFPKIPEPEGIAPDVCCLSKFNDPDYVKQLERAQLSK